MAPSSPLALRALCRHRVVAALRQYFLAADFVEVDTPVCVAAPAPEFYIDACPVALQTPQGTLARYLQTSPELGMKRLVAHGLSRIFQFACVFRDGDLTRAHRPEFRLLEWYRADAAWTTLLDDCEALVRAAAKAIHGDLQWHYAGHPVDVSQPFRRVSVNDAFRRHAGFAILDYLDRDALAARLRRDAVHHSADDTWDDLYHRVFLQKVEPALQLDSNPYFLTHFPAPLASLAQLCDADPRAAERFELYAGGLELANGFGELVHAGTQRARFVAERDRRQAAGKITYPLDEAFLADLECMPPTAGIALGLERLLMYVLDADEIDAVNAIPWSTP
jgi:lysyl-tRNA synthetase class 2